MCPKQQHHHPSIPKSFRPNRRALQDPSNFLTPHQHPNISYHQPSAVHQYSTQKKTHHTYLGPQPITPIHVRIRTTPILLLPHRQDSQTPEDCLNFPARWTVVSGPDSARRGAYSCGQSKSSNLQTDFLGLRKASELADNGINEFLLMSFINSNEQNFQK